MPQARFTFSISIKMPLVTGVGMLIPLLAYPGMPTTPENATYPGCSKATSRDDPEARAIAIVRAMGAASSKRSGEVLSGEERLLLDSASTSIRTYSLSRINGFRVAAETYDSATGQFCVLLVPIGK